MIRLVSILLARFFLSFVFLAAGVEKIFSWQETERSLLNALCDLQTYAGMMHPLQDCMAALVPWSSVLLALAILLELIGGFLLLFGLRERLGAGLLILFLIPATLIFHPFWFVEGSLREIQAAMFFKNLAILGGLILIVIHGARTKDDSGL